MLTMIFSNRAATLEIEMEEFIETLSEVTSEIEALMTKINKIPIPCEPNRPEYDVVRDVRARDIEKMNHMLLAAQSSKTPLFALKQAKEYVKAQHKRLQAQWNHHLENLYAEQGRHTMGSI